MNNQITNRFNLSLFAIALVIAAVAALSGVVTTRAYEDDGRLNLVHHLGGDAVFCAGADMTASDSFANGGIRLLSQDGQELFFVPAAVINAAPELPLVDTRIAQGWGTYGIVELWRLTNGDFSLIGQDEHGKQYIFQWTNCTQVGPIGYEGSGDADVSSDAPECDEPEENAQVEVLLAVTQEPDPGCEAEEPEYNN